MSQKKVALKSSSFATSVRSNNGLCERKYTTFKAVTVVGFSVLCYHTFEESLEG